MCSHPTPKTEIGIATDTHATAYEPPIANHEPTSTGTDSMPAPGNAADRTARLAVPTVRIRTQQPAHTQARGSARSWVLSPTNGTLDKSPAKRRPIAKQWTH